MKPLIIGLKSCLFAVAGLLVLSACQHHSATRSAIDPSGVYTLVSVNGEAVPAGLAHEGATLQIRSGSFTIRADGTCTSRMTFVPPSGPEVTRDVNATYTRDGTTLRMQWEGAGTTVGTVEGNTFTMNNEGMLLVYRK